MKILEPVWIKTYYGFQLKDRILITGNPMMTKKRRKKNRKIGSARETETSVDDQRPEVVLDPLQDPTDVEFPKTLISMPARAVTVTPSPKAKTSRPAPPAAATAAPLTGNPKGSKRKIRKTRSPKTRRSVTRSPKTTVVRTKKTRNVTSPAGVATAAPTAALVDPHQETETETGRPVAGPSPQNPDPSSCTKTKRSNPA